MILFDLVHSIKNTFVERKYPDVILTSTTNQNFTVQVTEFHLLVNSCGIFGKDIFLQNMTRPMNQQGNPPRGWGFVTDKNQLKFRIKTHGEYYKVIKKKK